MLMRCERETADKKGSDLALGVMEAQISLYSALAEGVAIIANILIGSTL